MIDAVEDEGGRFLRIAQDLGWVEVNAAAARTKLSIGKASKDDLEMQILRKRQNRNVGCSNIVGFGIARLLMFAMMSLDYNLVCSTVILDCESDMSLP
jgi:hypothetical protein